MNDKKDEQAVDSKGEASDFERLVMCDCGANCGCTKLCDRETNPFYLAIEEARNIKPSTRENTLNWILNRVAELVKIRNKEPEITCTCKKNYCREEIEVAKCLTCGQLV